MSDLRRRHFRAAAGTVTCVARRTALMTPSPLVPVQGALARPRVAPFDQMPSFGHEWGFRPGKYCLATLTTSCISVDRPHRACHWQPLPAPTSTSASTSTSARPAVVSTTVIGQRCRGTAGSPRGRRAMYAIGWTIGALGIIGWLIAAHELPTGFTPVLAIRISDRAPDHAISSTGSLQVAEIRPDASTNASLQRTASASAPDAKATALPPATTHAAARPASLRPKATSGVRRTGIVLPVSPHQTNGPRKTVARPPVLSDTAGARGRLAPAPRATDARDTFDDPLTLIAMANALRGTPPASWAHAPAAGFDWTSQLSHRRLTDAPDAFAR
ncbi:hypothetical protein [Burkholderia ambifaria]|uniref:hypothetical protein n=1 Tax=Burkholderia ambifaria TaxID=152480 RepID=UPI000D00D03E|nr:hypothetical protein [Burkholderia ambifaria]PRE00304.1 hypothetical protein C6P77_13990 [Burkholderia ambifaria]